MSAPQLLGSAEVAGAGVDVVRVGEDVDEVRHTRRERAVEGRADLRRVGDGLAAAAEQQLEITLRVNGVARTATAPARAPVCTTAPSTPVSSAHHCRRSPASRGVRLRTRFPDRSGENACDGENHENPAHPGRTVRPAAGIGPCTHCAGPRPALSQTGGVTLFSTPGTSPSQVSDQTRSLKKHLQWALTPHPHDANAVFAGISNPGGTLNLIKTKPSFTPVHTLDLSFGSFAHKRAVLRSSAPIVAKQLAYSLVYGVTDEKDRKSTRLNSSHRT